MFTVKSRVVNEDSVVVFPFGKKLFLGFSEEIFRGFFHPRKGDFVKYDDGSVECLRCGSDQFVMREIALPVFQICKKGVFGFAPKPMNRLCEITIFHCRTCDPPVHVDYQAVIFFEKH